MKPEANVQNAILDLLAAKRIRCHRLNAGIHVIASEKGRRVFRGQQKGCADILTLVRSRSYRMPMPVYIEVKAPGKKQTPEQKEFQAEVEAYGCLYLLADSVDVVLDWFKELGL